jgi:hypothetical protein
MSLAPSTEAGLLKALFSPSRFRTRVNPFPPEYAKMQSAPWHENKDIEHVALWAFFQIQYNKRKHGDYERKISDLNNRTIETSKNEIYSILVSMESQPGAVINKECVAVLIDHAIWELLKIVSASAYFASERDTTDYAASQVMCRVLYPFKSDTMTLECDSLLYKTVRYSKFKFGTKVLDAILSRNDQLFRPTELQDEKTVSLFKDRYPTESYDFDSFKAKPL